MNVHISYKAGKTPEIEREFQHQLEKLQKRLRVFRPELVHLHAILEQKNSHISTLSLNLRLPSGQMAASETADNMLTALKGAFADLLSQVGKHKEMLRGQWNWKSRRDLKRGGGVPVAQEIATRPVQPPPAPVDGDVSTWVNGNLTRLQKFVERELRYRVATGQIRQDQVTCEEVIDEVIVSALSHEDAKAEELSLESWFYRLALRAMRHLTQANADIGNVSLDASARQQNVTGSDENLLQYHQPDDMLQEESIIPDRSVNTPEEIVATEEMVSQLDFVLHEAPPVAREAFVLYTLEGFTIEEIARISDRSPEQVRKAIHLAREQVQRKLPPQNEFKRNLLRHSRVA